MYTIKDLPNGYTIKTTQPQDRNGNIYWLLCPSTNKNKEFFLNLDVFINSLEGIDMCVYAAKRRENAKKIVQF